MFTFVSGFDRIYQSCEAQKILLSNFNVKRVRNGNISRWFSVVVKWSALGIFEWKLNEQLNELIVHQFLYSMLSGMWNVFPVIMTMKRDWFKWWQFWLVSGTSSTNLHCSAVVNLILGSFSCCPQIFSILINKTTPLDSDNRIVGPFCGRKTTNIFRIAKRLETQKHW